LQLLRPEVDITPPPKDGSKRKTFGRFAGFFVCQGPPIGKEKMP
jgi:hypothetical protein